EGQCHHGQAEGEVQPIVGIAQRYEVGGGIEVDDQAVDEQAQVDDATPQQELTGGVRGAGQGHAGHTEEQVHDVVEDGHVEDTQEHGMALVACELQVTQVLGQAGNETGDADQEEENSHNKGGDLDG